MRTTITTLALALAITTNASAQTLEPAPAPVAEPTVAPAPAPASVIVTTVAPTPTVYASPLYAPIYDTRYDTRYAPAARGRPQRVQIGVRTERQSDQGLWGLGLGFFIAGWVLDFAVLTPIANAMSHDRTDAAEQDAWAWSLMPVVGPIVQLAIGAPHPAIPLLTGVMQIGGLVLLAMGLTSTHDAEVPVYAFGDPSDPRTARLSMGLAPMVDGGYATLTLHAM